MKLPVNPVEIMNEGRKFLAEKDEKINVALLIDPLAPDAHIERVTGLLTPQLSSGHLRVDVLGTGDQIHRSRFSRYTFVALVLKAETEAGEHDDYIRERVLSIKEADVPIAVVVDSGQASEIAARYGVSILDVVVVEDLDELEKKMGDWALDNAKQAKLALSANYPFMRDQIARSYVKATSLQNAAVGGILFIPGADMPVMTLNQMKMIMQIAAAYDQKIDLERVKELVVVLGGAFLSRTIARQLVGLVPALGFAIKAAIGYSATYAMGLAAMNYFREGGDVTELASYFKEKSVEISEKSKEIMADRKTQSMMKNLEKEQVKSRKLGERAKRQAENKRLAEARALERTDRSLDRAIEQNLKQKKTPLDLSQIKGAFKSAKSERAIRPSVTHHYFTTESKGEDSPTVRPSEHDV